MLLWPLPIFGVLLVVYMPVALGAGAAALLDWMHSYSVCRVGVGTGACCKLVALASNPLAMTSNLVALRRFQLVRLTY